ncbi:TRAP transporter large permease [Paraferrimonas sedimenticola]|uniref:TRAP transporter large permease protein n=1 Tax=Paraferrimonas sedimenticola TaxID=375674 RepID=A0AA37RX03_9GAMM|nr:TRAP transporter large permease subunit [Paraferrimonas sedimenticola]GLP96795.1 C4-dicarboxylate ABC transporter [Paraferrimonas sedimenticola]
MALALFALVCLMLMLGFPVAFTLAGCALLFAGVATLFGAFDGAFLAALPNRLFGIMNNQTLLAVPLFVFMGVLLEKSRIAEDLLDAMAQLFGRLQGGLVISVILVGMLLAASTGIVGATVVTMGLMSLPGMLKRGYHPGFAAGAICATGTLGQIIPPSIALVLLGDVLSSAYQQAQLNLGVFSPKTVSVGDLFAGALIPGLMLVAMYIAYTLLMVKLKPEWLPKRAETEEDAPSFGRLMASLLPPIILIFLVLGSILMGLATPTEASAVGAGGALILALARRAMGWARLQDVLLTTVRVNCMVFLILIGAALFSLVFRGLGGEDLIHGVLADLPGGVVGATIVVMLVIFLLGFILDFIEITFVVVPLVAPVLLTMGLDPVWLGIMIAVNLQTSFLTPPFGFALFYLRGVAPPSLTSQALYWGVLPFIGIQLLLIVLMAIWPGIATFLPQLIYG